MAVPCIFRETSRRSSRGRRRPSRAGLALSRGGWLYPKAGLVHAGRLARRMLEAAQAQVLTNMP